MKKLLNKKGFTLMEMLIVVAIIVILVAVSIPAFSGSLESAKQAADAANLRAAKAAYVMQTLAGASDADKIVATDAYKYYYDFGEGKFVKVESGSIAAAAAGATSLGECSTHGTAYIGIIGSEVTWTSNGTEAISPCIN